MIKSINIELLLSLVIFLKEKKSQGKSKKKKNPNPSISFFDFNSSNFKNQSSNVFTLKISFLIYDMIMIILHKRVI